MNKKVLIGVAIIGAIAVWYFFIRKPKETVATTETPASSSLATNITGVKASLSDIADSFQV